VAESRGFRPGIDLARINQRVDELEMDHFGVTLVRDGLGGGASGDSLLE